MMYGSTSMTNNPSVPDFTAKDGSRVTNLMGFTTLDALKVERHYCGAKAGSYKNKRICPQPDATGARVVKLRIPEVYEKLKKS